MVDHTFVYTNAVAKMRELIRAGDLGEIYYYDSVRINLGLFQHDVNVLWDLAVHDLSIMDYVLRQAPVAVSATGLCARARPAREHRLHDDVLRRRPDRPRPRELARAGEGAPHAARRQPPDDRLRRPRDEREDQGLRQGHHGEPEPEKTSTRCWSAIGPATCGRRSWAHRSAGRPRPGICSNASRHRTAATTDGQAGLRIVRMLEAATSRWHSAARFRRIILLRSGMAGVKFLDLQAQYRSIKREIDEAVLMAFSNPAQFVLGPEVEAFEKEFAPPMARPNTRSPSTPARARCTWRSWRRAIGRGRRGDHHRPFTFVATAAASGYTGARAGVRGYRSRIVHDGSRSRSRRRSRRARRRSCRSNSTASRRTWIRSRDRAKATGWS